MGIFREKLRIKVCSGCGRAKVFGDFYKNRSNEDGLDHYCKHCRQDYNADWVENNSRRRYIHQWRYRNRYWRSKNEINV